MFNNLYIVNLVQEIMEWIEIYKVTKKSLPELEENGFRIDYWGRPYTIINIPEELSDHPSDIEPYILNKFREFDELFLKLRLSDLIYPILENKSDENAHAYLLILSGNIDYFNIKHFILYMLKYFLIIFSSYKLIKYLLVNTSIVQIIIDFFSKII